MTARGLCDTCIKSFKFHRHFSAIEALRSHVSMSYRPNYNGGRRGGGRGRGAGSGRGRGGGSGGRGEQRWWDPQWRAERLRQIAGPIEKLDPNEWQIKLLQLKDGSQQELIVNRNFGREGQYTLEEMAHRHDLYFHAYNKGKSLVLSKVPLPNYRADLDERHGSAQKEIVMSVETEKRVESLLALSKEAGTVSDSGCSSSQTRKHDPWDSSTQAIKEYISDNGAPKLELIKERQLDCDKEKFSVELRDLQISKKATYSAKAMQSFREKLPAYKFKEKFLKYVSCNQVLVVSGETGCGKTTQLPQFILEDEISNLKGADCNIICTQPRRISAISVAMRVASERGETLGETVGYQIRLEAKRSAQTRLLFCTTGVLLRRLVQEPDFEGVSHLIVDEIHERGMNEDFLIIILRDLLPRRPDLRLILMSATINADLFSNYFGNSPIIHIPGFTFPVEEIFLEDILEKTRFQIRSEFDNFQGNSSRRRRAMSKNDPLTGMFEDVEINSCYKNYSMSTKQSLEVWSGSLLDLGLVEATVEYICRYEGEGAILVFLTGWDEISKLLDKIKSNTFLGNSSKFLVLPLHGSMPTVNQREIFDRPPRNIRKIILATNIAESSITVDDVVYVLDCGKAKETSYDALNKLACLVPSWISKASAHQRKGRAGRVQSGVCYRLYPKLIHDAMPQYQLPEILRTPLQELCLTIKGLQLGSVATFLAKALHPPDPLAVNNALELLRTIGALDDREELTPLGRHLCTIPLDPNIGKMLLMGSTFQCLDPALTIAAALAYRDPFVLPINRKEDADDAKRSFAGDTCSDHIALLKAFDAWKDAKRGGQERTFCWENFLSPMTLQMMDDMRKQFFDLLSDIGFVSKAKGIKAYNLNGGDIEMVRAILCAGLYPNVIQCKRRGKRTAFYSKDVGKVEIHPSSVNARIHLFPLPYMAYSEKVKTTSIFIRDSTNISDYSLLLFGGSLAPSKTGEGIEMLGGYLHFSAPKSVRQLIQEMGLLEVKHGLLQIAESLDFLHNNAHLIHRAISPETVFITSTGAWKLGGFGFAIPIDQASSGLTATQTFHYPEYDVEDSILPLQPYLNYTAPELVRSQNSTVGSSADIFSFACLAYHLIAGKPLLDCHNNVKMYMNSLSYLSSESFSPIPSELIVDIQRMLSTNVSSRPSALEFTGSSFFRDDTRLRALRFLDHMLERDNMQKTEFLKALSDMWKDFDARILRYKVLPPLCAELRNIVMQPMILPMVLTIAKSQDKNDFELSTLPALIPVLTSASGETLLLLVKNADLLVDKATQGHLLSHVLPLLVRAYDDSDTRTQEEVLRKTLPLARQLEMQLVKQAILPRVHGLALRTTVAAVRVNALRCLGDLVPSLDRQAVLDILQTLQRCTAVDHSAPTLMCTLGVSYAIYKQYGLEFAAEHVLPQVFPLLMAQQLSVQQFAKYMLFVKDILRKIEEKRGVTLTEYGASESRVSPSLSNELHPEPYQKPSGPVEAAKKTASWDEDWGSVNRLNANPRASNSTSKQTVSASQAISVTSIPSQSSMPTVSKQTGSIPPVDVEWPPPNSSVFVSQPMAYDKLNDNSNRLPDITFDDIDPFANWPPRTNGSSISTLSSSYKPNNNNNNNNNNSRQFSSAGSHDFNFSSNNTVILSKPYQESVVSITSERSMNTFAPNLHQPIGKNANPDIGSIFASANSIGHTAPKLAPPPLTAIGRSRGRNQASLSSQAKSSSQESSILDLL